MKLVNETNSVVYYTVSANSGVDCGQIAVDGFVDLPGWDNQTDVTVSLIPVPVEYFKLDLGPTTTGEQVEILVTAE